MKIVTIIFILLQCLIFIGCSVAEQKVQGNKILNSTNKIDLAQLKPCPSSPNCINTEYPDDKDHYLVALSFSEQKMDTINELSKDIILNMGGKVIDESGNLKTNYYLHATFTSTIFSFVDDFEIRLNNETELLHIRSSSRVGYSDFGVNKRRVKEFSKQFEIKLNSRFKQ
jgi:uncharacterized protein (DUF1499 family)